MIILAGIGDGTRLLIKLKGLFFDKSFVGLKRLRFLGLVFGVFPTNTVQNITGVAQPHL